MADTTKTVKSSGGDYSSLSAWEAGQQKSITSGNREIAECYAFDDTARCVIDGWTVPSGAEIIVRAATGEKHGGTWGTGYRMSYSASLYFGALDVADNYVTLDGISMRYTAATGGGSEAPFRVSGTATNPKILNSLIFRTTADETACFLNSIAGTGVMVNTVVVSAGAYAVIVQDGNWQFYNCDFVAPAGTALRDGYSAAGTIKVKNCYLHGSTAWANDGGGTVTFTTGRHSTAQSITGSTGSTAYSTANFTNVTAGSEDFALPSGSALIDAGTDLSADADYPFSTDILGATRGGTWEIGPFNYAAASGYTLTADQGSYTLTGQASGLRAGRKLAAAQGSYALTGQASGLRAGRKLAAAQGSYALTGQAAGLKVARMLAAAQGSYAITGQSAGVLVARRIASAQGSYSLTGQDAQLNYSGAGAKTLFVDQGAYTLTGQSVSILASRRIVAAQGAYALTGFATLLAASRRLAADYGAYTLTGQTVGLTYAGSGVTPVYENEPRWRFVAPGPGRRVGLASGNPGARRIGGRSA